jgi:hypothetical protein
MTILKTYEALKHNWLRYLIMKKMGEKPFSKFTKRIKEGKARLSDIRKLLKEGE